MKKKFSFGKNVTPGALSHASTLKGIKSPLCEEDLKQLKRVSLENIKISTGHEGEPLMDCNILIDGNSFFEYSELDWGGGDALVSRDIIKCRAASAAFLKDSKEESQFKLDIKGNPLEDLSPSEYLLNVFYFLKGLYFYERQAEKIKRLCKKSFILGSITHYKKVSFTRLTLAEMAEKHGSSSIRKVLNGILEKAGPEDVLHNSNEQLKALGVGDMIGTHPAIAKE